jgi:hypothetical protein
MPDIYRSLHIILHSGSVTPHKRRIYIYVAKYGTALCSTYATGTYIRHNRRAGHWRILAVLLYEIVTVTVTEEQ